MHSKLLIMKKNIIIAPALFLLIILVGCKKDIGQTVISDAIVPVVNLSAPTVSLSAATAGDVVETITWTAADYGFSAAVNYQLEIAAAGTNFAGAQKVNMGISRSLTYTGAVLNDLAIGKGIDPGTSGALEVRVRSALSDSVFHYSEVATLNVTTYVVEFPALLVRGGNGWVTPTPRTPGFVLTSPDFSSKYEGYINLPNADGWGGDALKLQSTSSGVVYGWGTSSTTIAAGSSGNLWFTPAPNYMKVNADINALTVNFTPVTFSLAGNHNGWSTSATPMTYDPVTRKLIATNVNFTAGSTFVFIANGGYDLSYKIDGSGKLIFAGPPAWAGNNIPVPGTGSYTVILDLSGGNGNYTYSIQ